MTRDGTHAKPAKAGDEIPEGTNPTTGGNAACSMCDGGCKCEPGRCNCGSHCRCRQCYNPKVEPTST